LSAGLLAESGESDAEDWLALLTRAKPTAPHSKPAAKTAAH
jgi:hypothetical protein